MVNHDLQHLAVSTICGFQSMTCLLYTSETVIRKHHLPAGSRFIGQPGERLTDLHLEVLGTRLQLDAVSYTHLLMSEVVR